MEIGALLNCVEAAVSARFPGEPIYRDRLPRDFKRPCFTAEVQKVEAQTLNPWLVHREVTVLMTCFTRVDAYGDSSRDDLTKRQENVMAVFGHGFLRVEDRAVHIQANEGESTPELAEVCLLFSWVDERPGNPDPGAEVPCMEHITINGRKD